VFRSEISSLLLPKRRRSHEASRHGLTRDRTLFQHPSRTRNLKVQCSTLRIRRDTNFIQICECQFRMDIHDPRPHVHDSQSARYLPAAIFFDPRCSSGYIKPLNLTQMPPMSAKPLCYRKSVPPVYVTYKHKLRRVQLDASAALGASACHSVCATFPAPRMLIRASIQLKASARMV